MKFQNRAQNYTKYRTQPNKLHKNRFFVHIYVFLCNNWRRTLASYCFFSYLCPIKTEQL